MADPPDREARSAESRPGSSALERVSAWLKAGREEATRVERARPSWTRRDRHVIWSALGAYAVVVGVALTHLGPRGLWDSGALLWAGMGIALVLVFVEALERYR